MSTRGTGYKLSVFYYSYIKGDFIQRGYSVNNNTHIITHILIPSLNHYNMPYVRICMNVGKS